MNEEQREPKRDKVRDINKILTTLSLSASDTREDTIKSIIRTTLLESKEPINNQILKENIEIIYDIELYEHEFNSILRALKESGEIVIKDENYSLSQEELEKLISLGTKLKSSEVLRFQNFKNFIEEKSSNKIQDEDIKLLWITLKDYLYECFYHYGVKAIEFLHPQHVNHSSSNLNHFENFTAASKKLIKQELFEVFKLAVNQFPDYATKEDLDFIDEIGQKTLAFASLGLSPEQASEELDTELVDWIIYLDTNFLFSVLNLHSNVENEACRELLKLAVLNKDVIKIKFRYSVLTLKELRHKKNDFINLDETLTNSAIKAILKSEDLDEFARKYYTDLIENRDTTIHPTKIIDLAEVTLPKEGIEISNNQKQLESLGEEFIGARITEYSRYINDLNATREEYSRKNNIHFRPYFRSDSQLNHDIVLRELILNSRKTFKKDEVQTFNEVKYFGLTLDELLIKFDNYKNRASTITIYPTFFRPSFLLNKLIKLLPVKTPDYKKAFLKAVSATGYHKEPQRSIDIVKMASYLKRCGIDNESVILNLISEKLFMEKFHQESSKSDFNSEQFFESELNKILIEKENEITESKNQLVKENERIKQEKEEKEKILLQKNEKEEYVELLTSAVIQLKKQVKKLEHKPYINVTTSTIDFEGADKEKKIEKLQSELETEKQRNNLLENERRKPLREKYIYKKILLWRLRTFIYILCGICVLAAIIIYLFYLADWKSENASLMLTNYLKNVIVAALLWLGSLFFSGFLIKRFSDQFNISSVNAFKSNIDIPEDLKEIKR